MAVQPKSERSKGKQPERTERNGERPEDPQPRSQASNADSDVDMVDDHDLPESSGSTNIAGNARLKRQGFPHCILEKIRAFSIALLERDVVFLPFA